MQRERQAPKNFTSLFGTRLPIVAGGLMWLSNARYVASAANAGILGFITAASFPDGNDLRNEIRKCRKMSNGAPFGVNISLLPKMVSSEKSLDIFKLIIEEDVKIVETSGRSPESFLPLLKEAGVKVIHKVPAVKYARKAQQMGVDAVSIVGAECGGHPGMDLIGSVVNSAMALEQLDIPFLIGGGIGHGAQIVAALAMGAAGVVIGTRFLVAEEICAHEKYKQALVTATENDTTLCMQGIRNTVRSLKNKTTEKVQQMEKEKTDVKIEDLLPYVSGEIGRTAYATGDTSHGILAAGHALAFVHKIEPLADIVASLERQADKALLRTGRIRRLSSE